MNANASRSASKRANTVLSANFASQATRHPAARKPEDPVQQRYAPRRPAGLGGATQLNSARFNLVNARYQVRIAKAQLEQLLGREIR
jgi:hypothetical protein